MNADGNIIPIDSIRSIKLKLWILEKMSFVLILFFFPKMGLYLIKGYDQVGYSQIETLFLILEFINLSYMMYLYRPREKWPDYFNMNILELQELKIRENNLNESLGGKKTQIESYNIQDDDQV